jgi:ribonuclease HI
MVVAKPHFLLFCNAHCNAHLSDGGDCDDTAPVGGRWHFVLERIDMNERLEAADAERAQPRDRLALLAVVRGLEAIEMPSQVTLVTTSRYVSRGLRYGLSEWREANYSWEHFGMQKPIRNADLWQRIDGALRYHDVACRLLESSLTAVEAAPVPDEAASPVQAMPAPHFPVRAAASVARKPRGASEPAWWLLAAGWMQWWRGRAARPSLLAGI